MATTTKNYLDLYGLQAYDALIKKWVDGGEGSAKESSGVIFRTVLFDSDNIYFYHKKDAQRKTEPYDVADVTVPLTGSDVTKALAQVQALVAAAGGEMAAEAPYTVTFPALTTDAKNTLVAAINELDEAIDLLNDDDTKVGSVANSIKKTIEALDVDEIALTEKTDDVISIYGIKEADGKIEKGSSKIDLQKVASTGKAEDVTTEAITDGAETDPKQLYAAGNVQGTLEAVARKLNDLSSEAVVTVEKDETATEGFLSTYTIKQNGQQVGVKIDIPKDYLVKSASVKTVEEDGKPYDDAKKGDKYIDFVVNVKAGSADESHIYIPVNDLMKALTVASDAEEVQLALSATNELSGSIVKVAAAKIAYSNTTSGSAVEETVQAALARIDGSDATDGSIKKAVKDAVEALDVNTALPFATHAGNTITIKGGIKEADGKIVDGEGDEIAITSIATSDINALFTA